jgi:large subunit ribosomal protein L19e
MNIRAQKRMAAAILKCGSHRVKFDRENIDEIAMAITRADVRGLIRDRLVVKGTIKGTSRVRAQARHEQRRKGRHRGEGSHKGTKFAVVGKKRMWINRIRPQRRRLRELRDSSKIDTKAYRRLYMLAKGGAFNSVAGMMRYIEENNLWWGA